MKNILVWILFAIPFISNAKFYQGQMTMKDSSVKTGFIEVPDDSTNKKVKFRLTEKGDTEKIELENIVSFIITNDKKEIVKYVITYLAEFKTFSKTNEFKIDSKLSCVKVIREGKINLYSAWFVSAGYGALGTPISSTSGAIYLNKTGNNYALNFWQGPTGGFVAKIGEFNYIKSMVKKHFEKDCPKLIEMVTKELIKEKGVIYRIDLYEQNCGN